MCWRGKGLHPSQSRRYGASELPKAAIAKLPCTYSFGLWPPLYLWNAIAASFSRRIKCAELPTNEITTEAVIISREQ